MSNVLLLLFILLAVISKPIFARLEAAVILPHGDVAYDPTLFPADSASGQAARDIHIGAAKTGHWLNHIIDPDVIFLSSPHGISLNNDFGLYLSSSASGSVEIGQDLHNTSHHSYTVQLPSIKLAPNLSKNLIDFLSVSHCENVTGVVVPSDGSLDMPLHWAEIIPLLLIPQRKTNNRLQSTELLSQLRKQRQLFGEKDRKHIIWTHPLRRYDSAPEMIPELLRLGKLLGQWLDYLPEKVSIVISSDLSHTHEVSGPYGYSNASAPFDAAIGLWASNPCLNQKQLLLKAAKLQPDAKSCGFTGMVLLHGILCSGDQTKKWASHVAVNRNATYFGMMAANFFRAD